MHVFVDRPLEGSQPLAVIGHAAIGQTSGLLEPASLQGLVPLVKEVAAFQVPVFVLHRVALPEPEQFVVGEGVHLADVDRVVAGTLQVLDPTMLPAIAIAQHAVRMRVLTGEEARAARRARCRRYVAIGESHPFAHEPVQVGRVHVAIAQFANRVEALLIGDDEDDVRPGVRHKSRILVSGRGNGPEQRVAPAH